jgi:enoyl-[acyl-carrier protein] reductase I
MYNLLKGKRGIIFGALDENSIAWKTAEKGTWKACFVLSNAPASIGWGQLMSLHKTGSQIIPADATSVADLEILVDKAVEALGGKIDFVLHSIGMSVNVRKSLH